MSRKRTPAKVGEENGSGFFGSSFFSSVCGGAAVGFAAFFISSSLDLAAALSTVLSCRAKAASGAPASEAIKISTRLRKVFMGAILHWQRKLVAGARLNIADALNHV